MMKRSAFLVCLLLSTAAAFADGEDKSLERQKDDASELYGFENKGVQGTWWNKVQKGKGGLLKADRTELLNQGFEVDWVMQPVYDGTSECLEDSLAEVQYKGKVGFVDRHGRFIIKAQFEGNDDHNGFHNGIAVVKKNGKYGFINMLGEFIVQPIYDNAHNFKDNLTAAVKRHGKWGCIDLKGNVVVEYKYKLSDQVSGLLSKTYRQAAKDVKTKKKQGEYDDLLDNIEMARYKQLELMHDGKTYTSEPLREYVSGQLIGIKDQYGRVVIPAKYDEIRRDSVVNLFVVRKDSLYGLFRANGQLVIPPVFESIGAFGTADAAAAAEAGVMVGSKHVAPVTMLGYAGTVSVDGDVSGAMLDSIFARACAVDTDSIHYTQARKLYKRIIRACPDYAEALCNVGIIEIEQENYSLGMDYLKVAHAVAPDDADIEANLHTAKQNRNQRRWNRIHRAVNSAVGVFQSEEKRASKAEIVDPTSDGLESVGNQ